ncbi:MAG: SCP2 sterol-binding domain-containing protein [Deltaproteobacteria bacterium]|nr:SCP2 sterol-binding domain-containing protein [Deltaproteobacteria bacterium]
MADKKPEQIFMDDLAKRISGNPDRAKQIGGIFEFVLDGDDGGTWSLDLGTPEVKAGPNEAMNVRIRMKDCDFLDIYTGNLNPMAAFTQGKLKVEGNIAMALKLQDVLSGKGW